MTNEKSLPTADVSEDGIEIDGSQHIDASDILELIDRICDEEERMESEGDEDRPSFGSFVSEASLVVTAEEGIGR